MDEKNPVTGRMNSNGVSYPDIEGKMEKLNVRVGNPVVDMSATTGLVQLHVMQPRRYPLSSIHLSGDIPKHTSLLAE